VPSTDDPLRHTSPFGKVALPPTACTALGLTGPVYVNAGGVTRLETPAGGAWAKTLEPPRNAVNRMVLPILGTLVPLAILRRDKAARGPDTLLRQAARIRELAGKGLPVPALLYADREFLITADCGQVIEKAVRSAHRRVQSGFDEAALHAILLAITRTIADIHRAGTAHGRPKMRDFVWRDGTVTILDLEEQPWDVMSMADAQARDVLLWIHDLCSAPLSRDIAPDAAAILLAGMAADTRLRLRRLLRIMRLGGPATRLMLRLLPGNRELIAGIAAYDILRDRIG